MKKLTINEELSNIKKWMGILNEDMPQTPASPQPTPVPQTQQQNQNQPQQNLKSLADGVAEALTKRFANSNNPIEGHTISGFEVTPNGLVFNILSNNNQTGIAYDVKSGYWYNLKNSNDPIALAIVGEINRYSKYVTAAKQGNNVSEKVLNKPF